MADIEHIQLLALLGVAVEVGILYGRLRGEIRGLREMQDRNQKTANTAHHRIDTILHGKGEI